MSRGVISAARAPPHAPNSGSYSRYLSEQKTIDLIEAAVHARTLGRPLNRFITIHLDRGEITVRPQAAIGRYLKLAGQWLADRGVPLTFIWTLEHTIGTGRHVHLLIHCPQEHYKAFSYRTRHRWLALAGIDPRKGVIHSKRVGPPGFEPDRSTAHQRQSYQNQLQGLLRYIAKAIDPTAESAIVVSVPGLGRPKVAEVLRIRPQHCSIIHGRRCSRSQNIGVTARKRHAGQQSGVRPVETPGTA